MNALKILQALDERLDSIAELTLYGRAAIQLGFANPPAATLLSMDVDAVFWLGQAEELNQQTNFWEAVEQVNQLLGKDGLYISHFFEEDMVILRPEWRGVRSRINLPVKRLALFRLSDMDLLLSKLMRDDPQDQADALFIANAADLSVVEIEKGLREARVPPIPEIQEQFALASERLLKALRNAKKR